MTKRRVPSSRRSSRIEGLRVRPTERYTYRSLRRVRRSGLRRAPTPRCLSRAALMAGKFYEAPIDDYLPQNGNRGYRVSRYELELSYR
ncbi:hypothetical protein, partial [Nocardia abscessus]|uniref:hypothetical protein n=1 Tax=Nocardia abscessus TaxID=120957 RepID=UPI0024542D2A